MSDSRRERAVQISIDLAAVVHNYAVAKTRSGNQKLFAVVKADAYGHGACQIAAALTDADAFAVVTLGEAEELRDFGITKPILILQGPTSAQQCAAYTELNLWPAINNHEQLAWLRKAGVHSKINCWLKIDTGMSRLGFQVHEVNEVLGSTNEFNWMGALTHFASADDPQSVQTADQIDKFNALTEISSLQKSMANSAGVLAHETSRADWARPGIMLYGSNPLLADAPPDVIAQDDLKPVMRVTAPLITRKRLPAGAEVGYAAQFTCPQAMDIGYLAIGYADGLPRVLGNGATVLLNSVVCPILGRVSMDSIAIDLTGVPQAQLQDRALIWGPEHPAEIMARAAGTISYELFTSIRGHRDYSFISANEIQA